MKLSRLVWMACLVAILVPSVAFAGGDAEGTSKAALKDVDPSGVTITYWYQHTRSREDAMQEMLKEFNSTNEWGITVDGEFAGGYDDIYNKMITAIAGGSTPDLVVAYQNQAAGYQVGDGLVDLNPYVKSKEWGISKEDMADYFEGFIDQDVNAQFGGQRLGFPTNRSIQLMYYNKDWLKEIGLDSPPTDWDGFREASRLATDPGAGTHGYTISTSASVIFGFVVSRGGDIAKKGGGYQFDTAAMKDSMIFMRDLYKDGYAQKIAEEFGDQTNFGNRKTLFTIGSTSGLPFYERAVESGAKGPFDWTVAEVPHTTKEAVIDIYGASLSVPQSTPEKQLAAWLFIKWLTEPKQQARWVEVSNYFPVRNSTIGSLDSYIAKNPKFGDAFSVLQSAKLATEPPYAGYDEVRDAMAAAYNAILDGADVASTLAELDEEANQIYEEASP